MRTKQFLVIMMLALCASVSTQTQAAGLQVGGSVGDEGNTPSVTENSRPLRKQAVNQVTAPIGQVFVWPSLNATNALWATQRDNALAGLRAGGTPVGNSPASFTPITEGQLGQTWMVKLNENGTGYDLRSGLVYKSPVAFHISELEVVIGSSDPGNLMRFTMRFTGLSPSMPGVSYATGETLTEGDPLINEVVIVGPSRAFILASTDTATAAAIEKFMADNRPWSMTFTYKVPSGSLSKTVAFNQAVTAPVANFSVVHLTSPQTVGFTDRSTPVGTIASWFWTFGDGQTSTAQDPTHTYGAAGNYVVTLRVISNNGLQDTESLTVPVTAPPPAPVANFTAGANGLTAQFTDQSTGPVSSWNWSFGDGTASSSVQNPTHTYGAGGDYTVTLTVTGNGTASTKSGVIHVTAPVQVVPVVANFAVNVAPGSSLLAFQFTDQSTGPVASWSWNFGDGTGSVAQNPSHTFAAGDYSVVLTVTGNGSTSSKTVAIRAVGPQLPTNTFNLGATTVLSEAGNVSLGDPLTITATIKNSGDSPYIGVISYSWQYMLNDGVWVDWKFKDGSLVGAGTVTDLYPGESKQVGYGWTAGTALTNQTYELRLKFVASDGVHQSDQLKVIPSTAVPIQLGIAPVPVTAGQARNDIIVISGPAGTYQVYHSEKSSGPWLPSFRVLKTDVNRAETLVLPTGSSLLFKAALVAPK